MLFLFSYFFFIVIHFLTFLLFIFSFLIFYLLLVSFVSFLVIIFGVNYLFCKALIMRNAYKAWSPVLSFHSLWWFGVQCHLLVLVRCVFWKPTSLHTFTKKCWSTSCFLLLTKFLKMLISNPGFHTTSAVPQTDHLHATPNWGSN